MQKTLRQHEGFSQFDEIFYDKVSFTTIPVTGNGSMISANFWVTGPAPRIDAATVATTPASIQVRNNLFLSKFLLI
jgi:hypothetical protein